MGLILLIALGIVLGVALLLFLPNILQLLFVLIVITIIAAALVVSFASLGLILSDATTTTLVVAGAAISACVFTLSLLKRNFWQYSIQIKKDHEWIDEADFLSYRAANGALKRRMTDLKMVYSDGKPISSALGISGVRLVRRLRWIDSGRKTPTVLSENLIPPTEN